MPHLFRSQQLPRAQPHNPAAGGDGDEESYQGECIGFSAGNFEVDFTGICL